MKRKTLIAICVFGFGTAFSQNITPQVIASAGDYSTSSNISLSWTIGETIIETFITNTNILSQGFNQTNLVVTKIDKPETESLIKVFPNPTIDELNIQAVNNKSDLYVELFDLNGRQLVAKELQKNDLNKINFSSYSAGLYLLKVYTKDNKIINNYKIQKIK